MGLQILGYWHQLPVSQCVWKHRWWDKFRGWDRGPRPCWCLENPQAPKLKNYSKWSLQHCCSFSFLVKPDEWMSPLVALSFPLLTLRTAFDWHSVFKLFSERLHFSSPLPVFLNEAMSYINQRLWQIIEPSLNNVVHACSRAVPNHAGLALTGPQLLTLPLKIIWICGFVIIMFWSNSMQHALVDVAHSSVRPSTLTTVSCWLTRCTLWSPLQDLEFMQRIHAHTPAC